jgi:hypothetical protein
MGKDIHEIKGLTATSLNSSDVLSEGDGESADEVAEVEFSKSSRHAHKAQKA